MIRLQGIDAVYRGAVWRGIEGLMFMGFGLMEGVCGTWRLLYRLVELAERNVPGWHIFAITLAASLFMAWRSIRYQSFNTALANPADSLQEE